MMHANPTNPWDAVIIGAGPAGASAAIHLARAGRRVLVIEKRPFPRHKVCGGCLSGPAAAQLRELLGPDTTPPGIASASITFVIGRYRITCNPNGATWMVSRAELDAALAAAAAAAGAEFRYGVSATLARGDTGWDVVCNDDERIRAGSVLIASGIGGVPKCLGIVNTSRSTPLVAQQWIQPATPPLPALGGVELHWLAGGYVGLATPLPGQCVVAMACERPDTSGESAFERLRRLNPIAQIWSALSLDAPRRYAARGTAGFPWIPDRLGDENVLLIGDTAGYAEPYSGEGIGQAMCSAACAAAAIQRGGDVLAAYGELMRRAHRPVVWRTRWLSAVLSSAALSFIASRRPVLPRRWLTALVEWVHVKGGTGLRPSRAVW